MRDDVALTEAVRSAGEPNLRAVRMVTAAFWALFVASVVGLNSLRFLSSHPSLGSPSGFMHQQVRVLGLVAAILAILTALLGLSYTRGLAFKLGADIRRARAVHMTVACCTIATIALHVLAVAAGSSFAISAAKLLVPFVWREARGFPYPLAAGIVALWAVVVFGLSYFVRARLGGHRRWRVLHRAVLGAVALSLLHTILLGWGYP
jgi:hypothetical protein